jgi:hypothetical protein
VDPYFLDQPRPANVRVEFGDRIAGSPGRSAPLAAAPRERPVQECRPLSDPER